MNGIQPGVRVICSQYDTASLLHAWHLGTLEFSC